MLPLLAALLLVVPADTVCTRVATIVTTTAPATPSKLDSAALVRCTASRVDTVRVVRVDTVVVHDTVFVRDSAVVPPPPPDTTTPPAPALPAWAQAVDRLLGPIPNCAQLAVATGPEREWYDAWRKWEPVRWKADSSRWDAADYYDRAATYYAMAACELGHDSTLSATYRARGDALALDYRDHYLAPNDGGASAHWSQLEGVALHALTTGDAASRRWVGRTADVLATTAYYTKRVFGDTLHIDYENRIGQRALLAALLAHELQSPGKTFPATRWPGVLDTLLTLTLRAQRPDGAWHFRCAGGCKLTFPYMDALLADAYIRVARLYRPDARILPAIEATVAWHLAHAVRPDSSWTYNLTPSTLGGATASPDLNGLHPATYAWLAAATGNPSYLTAVEPLFVKGVRAGYYQGSKQYNQAFYSSYRYVAMRQRGAQP